MLPLKTLLNLIDFDFVRLSRGDPLRSRYHSSASECRRGLYAFICLFRLKALQVSVPSRQAQPHSCETAHRRCFMSECAESMQCLSYACLARVGVPEQLGAVFEGQQLAGLVRCAGGHHLPILGSQKATG